MSVLAGNSQLKPARTICAFVCAALLQGPCVRAANADHTVAAGCPGATQPLAFWLGHWDVYADGKLDGRNFIETTLDGCAILEHWDDVSGMQGLSVFYYEPHSRQWKQVWITDHAGLPGGLKEKVMVHAGPDEVRFQGIVWASAERMILDRTTLRKVDENQVRQVIERSMDGGSTWAVSFDALYHRSKNQDCTASETGPHRSCAGTGLRPGY